MGRWFTEWRKRRRAVAYLRAARGHLQSTAVQECLINGVPLRVLRMPTDEFLRYVMSR
jgi:hypothetical protein